MSSTAAKLRLRAGGTALFIKSPAAVREAIAVAPGARITHCGKGPFDVVVAFVQRARDVAMLFDKADRGWRTKRTSARSEEAGRSAAALAKVGLRARKTNYGTSHNRIRFDTLVPARGESLAQTWAQFERHRESPIAVMGVHPGPLSVGHDHRGLSLPSMWSRTAPKGTREWSIAPGNRRRNGWRPVMRHRRRW